jgi:hypothetical protein
VRNSLFLFFFALSLTKGMAQDTINSTDVEAKTYQFYTDKNWKELIKYGNKAVKEGYDYFYLQMRIGIAFYEKKNYSLAEVHFKKALTFSSDDALALEYLYYCYIFNAKNDEARRLSKKFSTELAEKTGTNKQSSISFIMFECGTKKSDSTKYYNVGTKTRSNYFNPPTYAQLGVNHHIKRSFSLFHAFTYFNQEMFLGTVTQAQYYIKSSIPFKNNWSISPSFGWVNIQFKTEYTPIPPPNYKGPPIPKQTSVSQNDYYIGSLSIQKTIRKFSASLGTTISNISDVTQINHNGFIAYNVLGNSKLVIGCSEYAHTIDSYSTLNYATSPFVYVQPIKYFSIKASYLMNTNNNVIEENGYLVNNSPDLTTSRWSALVNFYLHKRFSLYGLYQLENKTEGVQKFNYKYNVFMGGLKIYL